MKSVKIIIIFLQVASHHFYSCEWWYSFNSNKNYWNFDLSSMVMMATHQRPKNVINNSADLHLVSIDFQHFLINSYFKWNLVIFYVFSLFSMLGERNRFKIFLRRLYKIQIEFNNNIPHVTLFMQIQFFISLSLQLHFSLSHSLFLHPPSL